jgi:hypothetical protein
VGPSWHHFGPPWDYYLGHLMLCRGHFGVVLGPTLPENQNLLAQASWNHLGAMSGPPWRHCGLPLADYLGHLGPLVTPSEGPQVWTIRILSSRFSGAILGLCWGHLGTILGHLGTIIWVTWCHVGSILGSFWGPHFLTIKMLLPRLPGATLGLCRGHLGAIVGYLGLIIQATCSHLGVLLGGHKS